MLGKKFFTSPAVSEYEQKLEQERLINDEFQTFVCNYKTTYDGKTSTQTKDISEWLCGFCRRKRNKRGREWKKRDREERWEGESLKYSRKKNILVVDVFGQ